MREKLAHQVLNPEVWPVFDLQVGYVDGMPARLWLCLDNLLLDGLSMQILLAELEHGYRYPATAASAAARHLQGLSATTLATVAQSRFSGMVAGAA